MSRTRLMLEFISRSTLWGLALGGGIGLSGGFVLYLLAGSLPAALYGGLVGLALGGVCGGLFGGFSGVAFGTITVLFYYSREKPRFFTATILASGIVVAIAGSYWLFSSLTSGYSYMEIGQASAAAPFVLISALAAAYGSFRMAKWYIGQHESID
jgi:hypothetical protein